MRPKRLKKKRLGNLEYREGSENIFADICIPNPEEAMAKAKIALKIHDTIKKKKLTQAKAAKLLKISQPKISLLLRGYLTDFSLERLLRFLNDLGQNVYISISPASRGEHGSTWVGDSPSKASIAALGR
jgi:predicted XRE-type DNA-binding protein